MVGKRVQSIIDEVSKEEGIPRKVVDTVVRDACRFVKSVMESGDRENWEFKTVDMPGLGLFNIKPSHTAKLRKFTEEKRKREQEKKQ